MSAVLSMYVGESEARIDRAFRALDALGLGADSRSARGVVVFIDEFDKIFPAANGYEGDSGVMMRITARTLTWMSESESPNLIVATANDITRLGAVGDTLTRKGRLDGMFFVDVPGRSARQLILQRLISRFARDAEVDTAVVAAATDRFTGADLEAMVKDAKTVAQFEHVPLDTARLLAETEANRRRVTSLYDRYAPLREWGALHCQPAGPADHPDY